MYTVSERVVCVFFFFQAEDGIRDVAVTGVQTCALPISVAVLRLGRFLFPSCSPFATGVLDETGFRCLNRFKADHSDRKSTRLNSSHGYISYAVFCLKKKKIMSMHHIDYV